MKVKDLTDLQDLIDKYEVLPAEHEQIIKDAIHAYNGFVLASKKMDECYQLLAEFLNAESERLGINIPDYAPTCKSLEATVKYMRDVIIGTSSIVPPMESTNGRQAISLIEYRLKVIDLLLES